jgi:hypothetical protein
MNNPLLLHQMVDSMHAERIASLGSLRHVSEPVCEECTSA